MVDCAFNNYAEEYDEWYIRNINIFRKEVELIRKCIRTSKKDKERSIEIGVGSGRFAVELGIRYGVDISKNMLKISKRRNLDVILADAHFLPFKNNVFSKVFIIFTLCFLKNPKKALEEIYRTLKDGGELLICFVPRDSNLGKLYIKKKISGDIFYSNANFYTLNEIINLNKKFKLKRVCRDDDIGVYCIVLKK